MHRHERQSAAETIIPAQPVNIAIKLIQQKLAVTHHVLVAIFQTIFGRTGLLLQVGVFFLQYGAGVFSETRPEIGAARYLFIL